jgi:hypothetical protein
VAELHSALEKVKRGDTVTVELWRDGSTRFVKVKTY